jgi:hypothetical protein
MTVAVRRCSVLLATLVLVTAACGDDDGDVAADTGSSTTTSAAQTTVAIDGETVWVAIVAASADPNDLEEQYNELTASTGEHPEVRLTLSRTACFAGLPSEVGEVDHVIAVEGDDQAAVEAAADDWGAEDPTSYEVQIACD